MNIAGKTVSIAAIVAAVGGVLAIVGSFMAWYSMSLGGETQDAKGMDSDFLGGKIALVLGIVILALVVAWIMQIKIPAIGAIILVAGVALLVVVVLSYFSTVLVTGSGDKMSIKDAFDAIKALGGSGSFGIGVILEAVAGVLAIVGGGLGLMKKSA